MHHDQATNSHVRFAAAPRTRKLPLLPAPARPPAIAPKLAPKLDASDVVQLTPRPGLPASGGFRGRTQAEMAAWLRQILARNLAHAARDQGRQNATRAARSRSRPPSISRRPDWKPGLPRINRHPRKRPNAMTNSCGWRGPSNACPTSSGKQSNCTIGRAGRWPRLPIIRAVHPPASQGSYIAVWQSCETNLSSKNLANHRESAQVGVAWGSIPLGGQ